MRAKRAVVQRSCIRRTNGNGCGVIGATKGNLKVEFVWNKNKRSWQMTAGEFKLVYTFRCHEYSHCKNKYFCAIASVEPEPNLESVLLNSVLTGEWQNISNQFRNRKCHRNNNRILSIDSASTECHLVPLTRCIALTTAPKTKTTLLIVRFSLWADKRRSSFSKASPAHCAPNKNILSLSPSLSQRTTTDNIVSNLHKWQTIPTKCCQWIVSTRVNESLSSSSGSTWALSLRKQMKKEF